MRMKLRFNGIIQFCLLSNFASLQNREIQLLQVVDDAGTEATMKLVPIRTQS